MWPGGSATHVRPPRMRSRECASMRTRATSRSMSPRLQLCILWTISIQFRRTHCPRNTSRQTAKTSLMMNLLFCEWIHSCVAWWYVWSVFWNDWLIHMQIHVIWNALMMHVKKTLLPRKPLSPSRNLSLFEVWSGWKGSKGFHFFMMIDDDDISFHQLLHPWETLPPNLFSVSWVDDRLIDVSTCMFEKCLKLHLKQLKRVLKWLIDFLKGLHDNWKKQWFLENLIIPRSTSRFLRCDQVQRDQRDSVFQRWWW